VELGIPLLDPERCLLGPGLELLAHPPELLLGIAIGEGIDLIDLIDLIDHFVEVGIESLTVLIGRSALLRRRLLRPRLRFGFQLRLVVARPLHVFRRAGKTSLVEIEFETEDLFIGGNGGRLLLLLFLIGPHLRTLVALGPPTASVLEEREDEKQQ
jgi:hypothetical protein